MTRTSRPEGRPEMQRDGCDQDTPHDFATAPVLGAVVHLGDPEIVAAEVIEAAGADFGRRTAAWLILLAEEVGA